MDPIFIFVLGIVVGSALTAAGLANLYFNAQEKIDDLTEQNQHLTRKVKFLNDTITFDRDYYESQDRGDTYQ